METEINSQKIQELKQEVKTLEGENKGFMQPEPPKTKNKGGRPPKTAEEKEATRKARAERQKAEALGQKPEVPKDAQNPMGQIPTTMICAPLVKACSSWGEAYAGHPAARLQPSEEEALTAALALVMDKYLPNIGDKYGPEMVLVMVSGQYFLRLQSIKKQVELHKAKTTMQNQNLGPENAKPQNKTESVLNPYPQTVQTNEETKTYNPETLL